MPMIFDKMNLGEHREILVINAPASFEPALAALGDICVLREPAQAQEVDFALAFVSTRAEADRLSRLLVEKARGDALLWFAYPKGSSRKYAGEINRDKGWETLRGLGFDTVRQVAIDDDWSALRFRRVEYIGGSGKRAKARTGESR